MLYAVQIVKLLEANLLFVILGYIKKKLTRLGIVGACMLKRFKAHMNGTDISQYHN